MNLLPAEIDQARDAYKRLQARVTYCRERARLAMEPPTLFGLPARPSIESRSWERTAARIEAAAAEYSACLS